VSKSKNAPGGLDRAFNFLHWGQQGCIALLVNLFICGFLGWGMYEALVAVQLERGGEVGPGTVVRLDEHYDAGTTYAPVVEYQVAGQTYAYTSDS
jgi:hypothetical protein